MTNKKVLYCCDTWAQCYKTFYGRNLLFLNKLECVTFASLSSLVQLFAHVAKPTRVKSLSGTPL